MQPFTQSSMMKACAIAMLMAIRGVKRNSLTPSGAVAAWVVGFASISCGLRGFLLLLFYMVGTKATKYKSNLKSHLDQSSVDSSCRGPSQVLACSVLGAAFQLIHVIYCGKEESIDFNKSTLSSSLVCALIAHHATSLGDTLASELGILSKSQPILITTGKRVPPGTNGGITLMGTVFSAIGGFIVGAGAAILDMCSGLHVNTIAYILFGTVCGLIGSIIDSILGATVQVTYFDEDKKVIYSCSSRKQNPSPKTVRISGREILSNVQVNMVSIVLTSAIGSVMGPFFF